MTSANDGFGILIDMEALGWVGGILVIVISFAWEHAGKKFKPWTWLLNWIGSRINKSMNDRLTVIGNKINNLEEADRQQDAKHAEQRALDARRHIISAADELRRNIEHSEEWFNSVLDDCTFYKKYCAAHTDFQNEKAVKSIQFIEDTYERVLKDDKFI